MLSIDIYSLCHLSDKLILRVIGHDLRMSFVKWKFSYLMPIQLLSSSVFRCLICPVLLNTYYKDHAV
jgi:hypothetical protein